MLLDRLAEGGFLQAGKDNQKKAAPATTKNNVNKK